MRLRPYQHDLIEASRDAFRRGNTRPLVVLPPGGGKTVCFAYMAREHVSSHPDRYVWFLVHRRELVDQARTTFTEWGLTDTHIFVGMVQTISRHPERYKKPTLIIFDEAHHATATSWLKIADHFSGVPLVGLTATPVRLNGDALGAVFNDLVLGVSASWLIDNNYLAPYDYYAPASVDIRTVRMRGADYDQDEATEVIMKSHIYGDVAKYINPNRRTIIYTPSVRMSRDLAERIPGVVHFDATTPTHDRDRIISDFRAGRIMTLTNVDLIGEGFNVPDCDTVIMLRPTQSVALYIQQSMRCMRYLPDKRATIYDLVGNVYRHGMPTDERAWSLEGRMRALNSGGEPDITCRQCAKCYRVYAGTDATCPYCNHNNGKSRREIEADREAELEKIEAVKKIENRRTQGRAKTFDELVKLGRERGYKNPVAWARFIIRGRASKL